MIPGCLSLFEILREKWGCFKCRVSDRGNPGIGLEVFRQLAQRGFTVLLGSRDLAKGEQAASQLVQAHLPVIAHQLDVTDDTSNYSSSEN